MSAGEVPFSAVTAKVMFKTVPVDVERSSEADHCPAYIVSGADSGSVKKHGADPLDRVRGRPRLPCVVLRPFTIGQSPGVIAGPASRKYSVPPNPVVRGDARLLVPMTNCDDDTKAGAPIPTVQSEPDDQSVASNTTRVAFVVGPTGIDPSISVAFFASAILADETDDHEPAQTYKLCPVIRPPTPRTSRE